MDNIKVILDLETYNELKDFKDNILKNEIGRIVSISGIKTSLYIKWFNLDEANAELSSQVDDARVNINDLNFQNNVFRFTI